MDRLSELKGKYIQQEEIAVDGVGPKGELDDFFTQVKAVQGGIRSIEQCTEDIKAKHSEALLNTDQEQVSAGPVVPCECCA